MTMPKAQYPFRRLGAFSKLFCDYVERSEALAPFYGHMPDEQGFEKQIPLKSTHFNEEKRSVLLDALSRQYQSVQTSDDVRANLESLKKHNTFTITTGHQLNLFTGPVYFLYKIITAIVAAERLSRRYPEYRFVPVYWMASEDHDFAEINHFFFKEKIFRWNKPAAEGAVGDFSTEDMDELYRLFSKDLGESLNADELRKLFTKAYLSAPGVSLAQATRILVNELFKDYGLVVIDGNDPSLKALFVGHMQEEVRYQPCFRQVSESSGALATLGYHLQVNPREINLFYMPPGSRTRIVKEGEVYTALDTSVQWSQEDLLKAIAEQPQLFSPNVLMRPLYQETVLPNLCYIGGPGELAYWLQLKAYFEAAQTPFPILMPRRFALLVNERQADKIKRLQLDYEDLFLPRDPFINAQVRRLSNLDFDFSGRKQLLSAQFAELYKLAEHTDPSFKGAVAAQERKQIKGLEHLEQRLLKAEKRALADKITRAMELKNQLFPKGQLQERQINFSEFYLEYGKDLIPMLKHAMQQPFEHQFLII